MDKSPKILAVAGEASGDYHAARLLRAYKKLRPEADLYGVGGPDMRSAGVRLIRDISDMSTFGVFEVFRQLPRLAGVFIQVLDSIRKERPDVVVLTDYPDFNILLARAIRYRYGKKPLILYYIAPQVWIWRRYRAGVIAKTVDRLAVVFPFEKPFFENLGAKVHFIGHPLIAIEKEEEEEDTSPGPAFKAEEGELKIVLMPGSRRGELENYMPPLAEAVQILQKSDKKYRFFILKAPSLDIDDFLPYLDKISSKPEIIEGQVRKILPEADFAVVALGTATLETALAGTPALLMGKVSQMTYRLAIKFLGMDLEYYSLVNFILRRHAFPELIQNEVTGENIVRSIENITSSTSAIEELRKAAGEVRENLTRIPHETDVMGDSASQRAAAILDEMVQESRR